VLPLLAGWDVALQVGRIFEYDGAGGCYERFRFFDHRIRHAPSPKGPCDWASTPNWTATGPSNPAPWLSTKAGDNDPSTGGPDFVRNLFPMIVTISSDGFQELEHDDVAERFRVINERTAPRKRAASAEGSLR